MKRYQKLLPMIAVCLSLAGRAQTSPEQDLVSLAIEHLRNLEYDVAKEQLRRCTDTQPSDLRAWNYLAIATLYGEMFERGVLEASVYGEGGEIFKAGKVAVTPAFQQELLSMLNKTQQLAEERLKNNPNDKDAMYWAGVGHGTHATYHFALRKEYMPALHEATAAYQYHSDLLRLDPTYVDSYLVVGMNNYIVGSLPWYIKAVAALTGRHGDRAQGLSQIKKVTEQGNFAREDAKLMLAVLYQREKTYASALTLYQEMARSYPRNYLLQYEVSGLFGMVNDWHSAAQTYDSILDRHRAGDSGYEKIPIAKVLYKSGQAYERLQQDESALNRYLEAAGLPGTDRHICLSAFAAANLYVRQQRPDAACGLYRQVADGMPDTAEGKASRRALRKLQDAKSCSK
jgi:tetratricopeptide (TPR) repeat protein